ncbi:MAG: hypothetical protein HQL14_07010 [Candidatus Omnitrophica bacterium]|nr:hypothetical protein [Candidatus Omnitrophota bacterium]
MKKRDGLIKGGQPLSESELKGRLKAIKCFRSEILPYLFVDMLNDFESQKLRLKNPKLKADIEECFQILEQFVDIVSIPNHKGKTVPTRLVLSRKAYPIQLIEKLNKVLKHYPFYVQVEFAADTKLGLKTKAIEKERSTIADLYKEIMGKIKKRNKQALPHLQLASFSNRFCVGSPSYPVDDETAGPVFANGLFKYVQGIVFGKKERIMRCQNPECNKWFLSVKQNNLTCSSDSCYEPYWRKARGGNKLRANAMKEIRKL